MRNVDLNNIYRKCRKQLYFYLACFLFINVQGHCCRKRESNKKKKMKCQNSIGKKSWKATFIYVECSTYAYCVLYYMYTESKLRMKKEKNKLKNERRFEGK